MATVDVKGLTITELIIMCAIGIIFSILYASKPTPTTFYSPNVHTRLTYPTSCATDHATWHLSIRQNFLITQTILFVLSISTHT